MLYTSLVSIYIATRVGMKGLDDRGEITMIPLKDFFEIKHAYYLYNFLPFLATY
jgi:hypothetical protein